MEAKSPSPLLRFAENGHPAMVSDTTRWALKIDDWPRCNVCEQTI